MHCRLVEPVKLLQPRVSTGMSASSSARTTSVRPSTDLARNLGCHGMWVGTEPGNAAALATYRAAGAAPPETFVSLVWTFEQDP